jgi:hypothetical protein
MATRIPSERRQDYGPAGGAGQFVVLAIAGLLVATVLATVATWPLEAFTVMVFVLAWLVDSLATVGRFVITHIFYVLAAGGAFMALLAAAPKETSS